MIRVIRYDPATNQTKIQVCPQTWPEKSNITRIADEIYKVDEKMKNS